MGINGLLPLLKSIQKPCHLKKFAGQTIGVDAYGWLHRGTVACAIDLALGKPTTKYVDFSMHRVRMLIHFGVIPYIVFDGDYLPSKAATEVERAKRREESKRKGLELYRLNKPSQAHLELQKAVDVTPEMARQLIDELKKIGVEYVVAPYEADAQLVYLERQGIIQGMLSEDSDLLVFGAKCLLTKLDQYGECVEINRADFAACREISLVGWSDAEFRRMAILSGCDYLASINRMGLKSAYRFVRRYKNIEKIIQMLQFDGQYYVPTDYLKKFYRAELTFLHQRVFCPLKKVVIMMAELGKEAQPEDFSFIGHEVSQDVAIGVAQGDLDPMTKQPIYVRRSATTTSQKAPWATPRRNTTQNTLDNKVGKSIESFFKAKRTPLAELDPNSFTPSPTQGRLLQQADGTTWESSPVPAGPPSLRSSVSMPTSVSRPALSARSAQSANLKNTASSHANSSKRRRLCLDSDDGQESGNAVTLDSERSRFFTSNLTAPSPSVKNSRTKRGRQTDIDIWSDDSIEDVMAGMPHAGEGLELSKQGKMEGFKNDCHEKLEDQNCTGPPNEVRAAEGLQSSNTSKGTVTSETSTSSDVASSTSSASSVPQTLTKHVMAELKALSQKCTYVAETEHMASQREIQQAKEASQSISKIVMPTKPLLQRQRSLTPLQRLGVGALNRSKSCSGQSSLPIAHSMGPDALMTKGSEDAVIPDSEDSADDTVSISEAKEQTKPQIDLGRFAFNG
ncbi:hypothetical protein JMJ35_000416 [Cladonia borealis]|uniref:Exonuclease 1 n=1 Tax=Cladonia borealis TaxID=184061 RepID=A0AA39RAJ7_9LECA|nr:hypothetical protein JMJ35_000416 [Cladonia borealis]